MDGPCSFEEIRACLRDLSLVNRITFAYRPTMAWLDRLAQAAPLPNPLRIVDVGCGYGDMLRHIEGWARDRGIAFELIGIDLNEDAVRAAREATPTGSAIQWIAGNVYELVTEADLIISSLVTHHLTEDEIVRFLQWMERTARVGWFINDLHRKAMPYYAFSTLMRGPWWHRFIRADGMTSIRRSFLEQDWERMLAVAGLAPNAVDGTLAVVGYRPARLCVERS